MKSRFITNIFFFLLFTKSAFALPDDNVGKARLSGKVTDAKTHEPLPAVTLYFPEIKVGTLSDANGNFQLNNLPASRLVIQVSFVGYQSVTKSIDLSKVDTANFALSQSVTEISEVVITGQSGLLEQKRTPAPIEVVPHSVLLENASTNIIDALAKEPGVSEITTGSGISKPVIRGLGYNRVVVVNDGIRQEGQQWGDEHGVEIDEYSVNHVEILKGPASLAFGSDAMAGVINMLSAPALPQGVIKGNIISNYQTNNGLIGYSVNLAGNHNGFTWDARYSQKLTHDYKNRYDGYVFNSRFRENAARLQLGFNRAWGYSQLILSLYKLEPGMIEGERDSITGRFLKITTLPDGSKTEIPATLSDFKSYQPDVPFQKVAHYKAVWNNKIYFGKGNIESIVGFQQNNRKEFESKDNYGLFFKLNTINYDVKYTLPIDNNWTLTSGVGGMWQQSENLGSDFLVPAYQLFDFGIFAIAHKKWDNFDLSGGLRLDNRSENADALFLNSNEEAVAATNPDAEVRFAAFNRSFTGGSGSVGLSYQVSEKVYSKLNISRGYRAPNIAELGSNGVHEGTFRYEIGNPNLKPESSLQIDWGAGMNTEHVSAELSLFNNQVNHFIYSHKLNTEAGADSLIDNVEVFQFEGGKAHLYGGEFYIDIHPHPLDFIHFENTFSYTRGILMNQPDSASNLPMIPAARWLSEIKLNFKKVNRWMENAYLSFGIDHNWKQNHYFKAFGTETATPGYTLLNAGIGTDFTSKKRTIFSLYISCSNLANVAYQNHLSRLKYAGYNYATGRQGVFNMGRNISFKLLIPVDFTSSETME